MSTEVYASKEDTIAAIATPPGRSGVAVIRISGPKTINIIESVGDKALQPRTAEYLQFLDEHREVIDQGLALFFPKPASYTGEDVLELHCHGSVAVVEQILRTVISLGARLARPGEFTERAYLNGKLDLVQAEAVADIIDSASSQASKSAIRTLQGDFSREIKNLLNKLVSLRAYVEGALDFPEEEIDFLSEGGVAKQLHQILEQAKTVYEKGKQGKKLHDGIVLVIIGEPNTGKSSLLNRLSGLDAAIVTDIPGTTRDLLEHDIIVDGLLLKIIDTAGIRESNDPIEQEGIRRAKKAAEQADAVVIMTDYAKETDIDDYCGFDPQQKEIIIIRNKTDLYDQHAKVVHHQNHTEVCLSAKTGEGLDGFINVLKEKVFRQASFEGCFSANQRHIAALELCCVLLDEAEQQLNSSKAGELLAEDLRKAQEALGEITGEFFPDDLLGEIFSRFCIGK